MDDDNKQTHGDGIRLATILMLALGFLLYISSLGYEMFSFLAPWCRIVGIASIWALVIWIVCRTYFRSSSPKRS